MINKIIGKLILEIKITYRVNIMTGRLAFGLFMFPCTLNTSTRDASSDYQPQKNKEKKKVADMNLTVFDLLPNK